MGTGLEIALWAGAGATAYSAYAGAEAAQDQADAQKESIAAQQRSSDYQAQRARIQAVRESRIRQAQMTAGAGQAGIGFESSGVVGAQSSLASQLGSTIGASNVVQGFAGQASAANQRAADAAATGAMWQAIGSVSSSAFSGLGGWKKLIG